jgi:hypothetical protein
MYIHIDKDSLLYNFPNIFLVMVSNYYNKNILKRKYKDIIQIKKFLPVRNSLDIIENNIYLFH